MRLTAAAPAALIAFLTAALAAGPALAQDDPPAEEPPAEESEPAETPGVVFAGVIEAAVAAWDETGDPASGDDAHDRATFVVGNLAWFMFHEFGHALITEYQLPVLGKEEDAVDMFATITMVIDSNDEVLDAMISEVVEAWFDGGLYANLDYGQHSVDEQRAYMVICMLVGSDPEGYAQYATDAEMPADRQESCQWDFKKADEAWKGQLAAHLLDEGEAPTAELPVTYGDPGEYGRAAQFLQATGVLEAVAGQIGSTFRIGSPIGISAEVCGQANAFWRPGDQKVVLCYEMANHFLERASIADDEEADGQPDAEPSEEPAP